MSSSQSLFERLNNNTVFADFMAPLFRCLEKVRYHESRFTNLTMPQFASFGCLRHLKSHRSLREQVQQLFHLTDEASLPVARSTLSDAMNSELRLDILVQASQHLVKQAQALLPDRLAEFEELSSRPVYAVDASYQQESAHYGRCTPRQGGTDNPKGHMMLTQFDVRLGLTVRCQIERSSSHEMLVFKQTLDAPDSLLKHKHALWVVDRGFIDLPFWDRQQSRYRQTVITRWKESLVVESSESLEYSPSMVNECVLSDERVQLRASRQAWRLISYRTPEGGLLRFLTNDFDLKPGMIAFMYLRRWDQEKSYDTWKNDFASGKAWSKSQCGLTMQLMLAMITALLLALFCHRHQGQWRIDDEKSLKKQDNRLKRRMIESGQSRPWYSFYYRAVSKVSRQVIRFLQNCFLKPSTPELYERQLKPMILKYL